MADGTSPDATRREAKALSDVLADEELALLFRDFLHQLHSAENLSFWLEIQEFKQIPRSAERRRRAEEICLKYLDSKCDAPVNVDAELKDTVRQKIESEDEKIKSDIFDEMSDFIYGMMEFDSFRKFVTSELYRKWQDAENNSGKNGKKKDKDKEKDKDGKRSNLFSRLLGSNRKKTGSITSADGASSSPPTVQRTDSVVMLQNHVAKASINSNNNNNNAKK